MPVLCTVSTVPHSLLLQSYLPHFGIIMLQRRSWPFWREEAPSNSGDKEAETSDSEGMMAVGKVQAGESMDASYATIALEQRFAPEKYSI